MNTCGMKPRYVVRIITLDEEDPSKAMVDAKLGLETDNVREAKLWARSFNEAEIEEPIGAFAVVQRCDNNFAEAQVRSREVFLCS